MSNNQIIQKYWKAANDRHWDSFESLLDEKIIYDLPQTRERIRGREIFTEFNKTYPGKWSIKIIHLICEDEKAVSEIRFLSDEGEQTGISFFEINEGKISRIVEYWPEPYQPPERKIGEIERY